MTKKYLESLNDRKLVSLLKEGVNKEKDFNLIAEVLLERYEPQIHKNWWKLIRQMNWSPLIESLKDDYYSDAYEAFFEAVKKVDLSKVKNDNWQMVGYADFYLRNVRSKYRKLVLKEGKNKQIDSLSIYSENSMKTDPDVEKAYQENNGYKNNPEYITINSFEEARMQRAIERCYSGWNPKKKHIFDMLEAGMTKSEIAKQMQVRPMLVYNNCYDMRKEIISYMEK